MNLQPTAKPFLKWAGGKTQLLNQLEKAFPKELKAGKIKRYIEPFVGAGAVFFYIAQNYSVDELIICDINPELILVYKTIQYDVDNLIASLSDIQSDYLSLDDVHRKEYYYKVRNEFNLKHSNFDFTNYKKSWTERSSQTIFLNRTCFNGLFRVNSKGGFNVPVGSYKNPKICHPKNLKAVAKVLEKTEIRLGDFTSCKKDVDKDTFVYFDPPYRPISKTANFKAYANSAFGDDEQLQLRDFFQKMDCKGAKLLLSNSDPQNEDKSDCFFEEAYEKFNIKTVAASRSINSNASKRGFIKELLISNY